MVVPTASKTRQIRRWCASVLSCPPRKTPLVKDAFGDNGEIAKPNRVPFFFRQLAVMRKLSFQFRIKPAPQDKFSNGAPEEHHLASTC